MKMMMTRSPTDFVVTSSKITKLLQLYRVAMPLYLPHRRYNIKSILSRIRVIRMTISSFQVARARYCIKAVLMRLVTSRLNSGMDISR